ncbi:MAG: hypothetical protein R2911_30900 [Caldilineaceae bacterium]
MHRSRTTRCDACQVGEDFRITLTFGTPLAERFRVERFAQWQSSYPDYVYQMNQRSLTKAVEGQIAPSRLSTFWNAAPGVPEKVLSALDALWFDQKCTGKYAG